MLACINCRFWESVDQNIITHSRCEHPSKDKIKTRAEDTCEFAEGYRPMTEDEYSEGVGSLIEDWEVE